MKIRSFKEKQTLQTQQTTHHQRQTNKVACSNHARGNYLVLGNQFVVLNFKKIIKYGIHHCIYVQ